MFVLVLERPMYVVPYATVSIDKPGILIRAMRVLVIALGFAFVPLAVAVGSGQLPSWAIVCYAIVTTGARFLLGVFNQRNRRLSAAIKSQTELRDVQIKRWRFTARRGDAHVEGEIKYTGGYTYALGVLTQ